MTPQELRAWRTDLHLTQTTAAVSLGVGLRTYVGYENGAEVPRAIELATIALRDRPELIAGPAELDAASAGPTSMPSGPAPVNSLQLLVGRPGERAGVVEVAMAAAALAQHTLAHLVRRGVLDAKDADAIVDAAIDSQANTPAPAPWRTGTVGLLDAMRDDVQAARRRAR